jgi:hypothetical protein
MHAAAGTSTKAFDPDDWRMIQKKVPEIGRVTNRG